MQLIDLSNQPLDGRSGAQFVIESSLFAPAERFGGQLRLAFDDIAGRLDDGSSVVVVSPQAGRIRELGGERGLPLRDELNGRPGLAVIQGALGEGWQSRELGITLYTDSEIFGFQPRRPVVTRRKRQQREIDRQAFLQTLKPGDHVVHIEHGIAIYEGLRRIDVEGIEREYLHLRYAAGDALYVPVDQIDRVSQVHRRGRFDAGADASGHRRVGARQARASRPSVEELARELLELYAARQLAERPPYQAGYAVAARAGRRVSRIVETDDQLQAIADVKHDMEHPRRWIG